jgi:hypothetical protein
MILALFWRESEVVPFLVLLKPLNFKDSCADANKKVMEVYLIGLSVSSLGGSNRALIVHGSSRQLGGVFRLVSQRETSSNHGIPYHPKSEVRMSITAPTENFLPGCLQFRVLHSDVERWHRAP